MVAQKGSMRESAHKFAKGCSIIFRAVFSSVVPLYRYRSTCSITPAFFVFSYFLFSGAMGNKNNDKFTGTTCTQWATTAALLTTEIVGKLCRALHKINTVDFLRPLVGRF
jgi:hypothetical protein